MAETGDAEKAEQPAKAEDRRPSEGRSGGRSEGNEWTLSDSRGPLGAAEADGDVSAPADSEVATSAPPPEPASDATAEPASSPPPPSASLQPERRQSEQRQSEQRHLPVLPIIAALVVGAVIGAASAAIVYKSAGEGASQGDVDALASRLDALEKRPDPQPELAGLKTSIAKLSAAQKPAAFDPAPLQDKIAGLQRDVDGLKTNDADRGLADKVTALEGTIGGLKTQGADVKGLDDKVASLATAVDGLKKQDATRQADIATLQGGQKALEGKAGAPALAVVADSLIEAIAAGKPYASQVEAAATLGADPAKVAVLRENADKGVPSAQALAARFVPLADPLAASANHAPANAGLVDRLKSGMLSMVSIRRADGTSGDDPGSRVSRIEADLAHDDVAGAYAAWDGLPPGAKAKSEAWGALAKTHVEAMDAARALQQHAIAALGSKKS